MNTLESIREKYDLDPTIRPYHIPRITESIIDDSSLYAYIEAIEEGLDISLIEYPEGIVQCLRNPFHEHLCARMSLAYPEDYTIRIPCDLDPTIIDKLKERLNVVVYCPSYSINAIEKIMNTIVNCKSNPSLILSNPSPLLLKYVSVIDDNIKICIDEEEELTTEQLVAIIDSTRTVQSLLNMALHNGCRQIVESIYRNQYNRPGDCNNLAGYKLVFKLLDKYPNICNDVNSSFIKFINLDTNLQYCNRIQYYKYWTSIDITQVENPRAIRLLKRIGRRIPSCNEILSGNKYNAEQLRMAERMCHASDGISKCRVNVIISMLREDVLINPIDTNEPVMSLLLTLHLNRTIKLNDYRRSHPFIDFIIDRLH